MFKVGDKVIEKETGDIGTITRRATEDCEGCWYVLWETGSESGKEFWLPEADLAIYTPVEVTEEKIDLLKRIEELESEVKLIKGMLSNV